jgi:hypothetical protein
VLLEFSDGVIMPARLLEADAGTAVLQVPPYRTGRGTQIALRTWRIVPADEPGLMRVQKRIAD